MVDRCTVFTCTDVSLRPARDEPRCNRRLGVETTDKDTMCTVTRRVPRGIMGMQTGCDGGTIRYNGSIMGNRDCSRWTGAGGG